MRAFRAFTVTAAACAAVGLSVPFAAADPSGTGHGPSNISVNPFRVHQGSTMQVSANGCGRGGVVRSHGNFDPTLLSPGSTNFATVRIYNHAAPGIHTLQVQCNDSSLIGTHRFQILSGNGAQGGIGGSIGPSATETAIGAGLIGAAALGAGIHLKRRHRAARGRS
ncbi:hypothetical protein [Streptomyces bambusae]|uniref:Integral membrane protein n=1 Tax=Streptomyces bambusae TaxID=1550616 RepID=A0ABS6ZHN1_9ACTN|nr:hypothetical protein [Streptomyces bambusae]MBW5486723.1 hypothetical protein [Streptomyces bambusae]